MRIPTPCCICFTERKSESRNPESVPIPFYLGRVSNNGFVRVTCPNGHDSLILFNERKHDLLFRSACHTLIAGYEREAISSFSAAMERVYEFYTRVAARHYKIPSATFEHNWNLVVKRSERQLGMFIGFHSLISNSSYQLPRKMVEFRNQVIHQGYIPTEGETYDYGSYVFDQKSTLIKDLSEKCRIAFDHEVRAEIDAMDKSAPQELPRFDYEEKLVGVDENRNTAHDFTRFQDYIAAVREKYHNRG